MPQKILFVLLLLVSFGSARAEVKDVSDRFAFGFSGDFLDAPLSLTTDGDKQNLVKYRPASRSTTGAFASLFGLTVGYSWYGIVKSEDEYKHGTSQFEDYRLGLNFGGSKAYVASIYYNRYKGFYIENSQRIDPSIPNGNPEIQRPDLQAQNFGAQLTYVIHPEQYAPAAAFSQSSRQLSTGGSWMLSGAYDALITKADTSIVPSQLQTQYGSDASFSDGQFQTTSAMVGYGGALVAAEKWFAAAQVQLGPGLLVKDYSVGGSSYHAIAGTLKTDLKASVGFNGENFFSTFQLYYQKVSIKLHELYLAPEVSSVHFNIGYRF